MNFFIFPNFTDVILRLETEKYDLEERGKRQGHDVRTPITQTFLGLICNEQFSQFQVESIVRGLDVKLLSQFPTESDERALDFKSLSQLPELKELKELLDLKRL